MRIIKSIFMFIFNLQLFQNELCKKKITTIEEQLNHIIKFTNVIQFVKATKNINFQCVVQFADVEMQNQNII